MPADGARVVIDEYVPPGFSAAAARRTTRQTADDAFARGLDEAMKPLRELAAEERAAWPPALRRAGGQP